MGMETLARCVAEGRLWWCAELLFGSLTPPLLFVVQFMHDRGDYKSGAQLEADWNKEQAEKLKRRLLGQSETVENFEIKEEEELPWGCPICRGDFVSPVVTKCKHYFCEKCALDAYVKDTKCFSCRAQTHGIFNTATELIGVLKKRAASGTDKRAELEEAERARLAEKQQERRLEQGGAVP